MLPFVHLVRLTAFDIRYSSQINTVFGIIHISIHDVFVPIVMIGMMFHQAIIFGRNTLPLKECFPILCCVSDNYVRCCKDYTISIYFF